MDRDTPNAHHGLPLMTQGLYSAIPGHPNNGPEPPSRIQNGLERLYPGIAYNWRLINMIVERHEALIQKRWAKKTKAQRLETLLKAWPDMPARHRPDFWAYRKETAEERNACTKYRYHFLLPYINQEDLCKPHTLPLLLNARGRNVPSVFAGADADALVFPVASGAVRVHLDPEKTVILGHLPKEMIDYYGAIMATDKFEQSMDDTRAKFENMLDEIAPPDDPVALEMRYQLTAGQIFETDTRFQVGEARLVLEVQSHLLDFLMSCCHELLHHIPAHTLVYAPVLPEPQLSGDGPLCNGFGSLSAIAAETPYRTPEKLDLALIESLVSSLAAEAEDRLWSLREDPLYFHDLITDHRDHRPERIKDRNGLPKPESQRTRKYLIRSFALQSIYDVEAYSTIRTMTREVRRLQLEYAHLISPRRPLPQEYEAGLVKLRYYLKRSVQMLVAMLCQEGPGSPTFRHLWQRQDLNHRLMAISPKPGVKLSKVEEHMVILMSTLRESSRSSDDLQAGMVPLLIDEMERLLQAEPDAKRLASPYIAGIIGEVSIINQCLQQVELYHPWSRTFIITEEEEAEAKSTWEGNALQWSSLVDMITHDELIALAEPLKKSFPYPIDKYRTQANVDALRAAEANLDAFWNTFDERVAKCPVDVSSSYTMRLWSQPRLLQRTPPWVGPLLGVHKGDQASMPATCIYEPMSRLFSSTPESTSKEGLPLPKTKTRGTSSAADEATGFEEAEEDAHDAPTTYAVDARALKVFRNLFFAPDISATPGEIPWNDFCYAMTSVGFTAVKGYGSTWNFTPGSETVGFPISFHEPHPGGKIRYVVARRQGRRLQRAYGWGRETFVLKDRAA